VSDAVPPVPPEPGASTAEPNTHVGPPSIANRFVQAALNQPFLVAVFALTLLGVGIWSFLRLPVDAYPDLSPPLVSITTQWPGHAAEEIERLVTVPMEREMNGIERVKVVRSVSLYGLSHVVLTFQDGTDPYFARQRAFEHLPDVTLPTGVTAGLEPLFSPSGLVYRYVLESPDRSAMELKIINDWVVAKALKGVPGVADIASLGGETMQYQDRKSVV
jgi:cobalt-zinc-cadmium resistance protein CzcA